MNVCIVLSSGGSVVDNVLKWQPFREKVKLIVTDRDCAASEISEKFKIPLKEIRTRNNDDFSNQLLEVLHEAKIDLVLCFHLRLLKGKLLREYKHRLINFHLSLLPAFAGFNSFENALAYDVKVFGSTIHFIDDSVDLGMPIVQTVVVNEPALSDSQKRHKLFVQQCKSLVQMVSWFEQGRVMVENNRCIVKDASYKLEEVIPNLEMDLSVFK